MILFDYLVFVEIYQSVLIVLFITSVDNKPSNHGVKDSEYKMSNDTHIAGLHVSHCQYANSTGLTPASLSLGGKRKKRISHFEINNTAATTYSCINGKKNG